MKKYLIGGSVGLVFGAVVTWLIWPYHFTNQIVETTLNNDNSDPYNLNVLGAITTTNATFVDVEKKFEFVRHTSLFSITEEDIEQLCLATEPGFPDEENIYLKAYIYLNDLAQNRIIEALRTEGTQKISVEYNGFPLTTTYFKENASERYNRYRYLSGQSDIPPFDRKEDLQFTAGIHEDVKPYRLLETVHFLSPSSVPQGCPVGFDSNLITDDWEAALKSFWEIDITNKVKE
ncbi:hypothetical protein [Kordiimonas pumila]|uniref:DUF4105 domain-containing protein n=1 Tax=Kordiimonas pumila TaxID=2161677 RepID=A0ABV7D3Q3_9PROT|nr:hypothetical protein [Kordiimonas pumila]